ncbi:MAG: hypothetical protein K2I80_06370 [Ruminococcus sp.]|nr:hypothetical protein [Ruminococcus sp.]MDE6848448.1 hypothetical protein [Ruminococcus sp.]
MHRIINLAIVISLTFATLICLSEKDFCAIAYETPSDIHLLIETKEIDINDIPENRMISHIYRKYPI